MATVVFQRINNSLTVSSALGSSRGTSGLAEASPPVLALGMVRKRANLLRQKQHADERRYRYRARFERPGDGIWDMQKTLFAWLDQRLGKGNYAFHSDPWDGHGKSDFRNNCDTFALHFNDHTIIPDLLEHFAAIKTWAPYKPRFKTALTRRERRVLRAAIVGLQSHIVDKLNAIAPRVVWAMGRCAFVSGEQTMGDRLSIGRIYALGEIDTALSVVPADTDQIEILIDDYQRGALETGLVLLRDLHPTPTDLIEPLQAFVEALDEVR